MLFGGLFKRKKTDTEKEEADALPRALDAYYQEFTYKDKNYIQAQKHGITMLWCTDDSFFNATKLLISAGGDDSLLKEDRWHDYIKEYEYSRNKEMAYELNNKHDLSMRGIYVDKDILPFIIYNMPASVSVKMSELNNQIMNKYFNIELQEIESKNAIIKRLESGTSEIIQKLANTEKELVDEKNKSDTLQKKVETIDNEQNVILTLYKDKTEYKLSTAARPCALKNVVRKYSVSKYIDVRLIVLDKYNHKITDDNLEQVKNEISELNKLWSK